MTWQAPELMIAPPQGAIVDGLKPIMPKMLSWENKNGFTVLVVGYNSDPDKTNQKWWNEATKNLRRDQVEQEYLVSFKTKGGKKVFPELSSMESEIIRPSYRVGAKYNIPDHWPIVAGFDYGATNPTSINFYAIDEENCWHAFWEFYQPVENYKRIARVLLSHPMYNRVLKIASDPSIFNKNKTNYKGDKCSIAELLYDEGIYNLIPAVNDRIAGLARVKECINPKNLKLLISEDCPNLYTELCGLVYKPESPTQLVTRNYAEDVMKKDDHAYDNFRYARMSFKGYAEHRIRKINTNPPRVIDVERAIDDEYKDDWMGY